MKIFGSFAFTILVGSTTLSGGPVVNPSSGVVVLNAATSPFVVTAVETEVVTADQSVRLVLEMEATQDRAFGGLLINTFSRSGECKRNTAARFSIDQAQRSRNQVVMRLVHHEPGDVTVVTPLASDDLREITGSLSSAVRRVAEEALQLDLPEDISCRQQCRAFEIDCNILCIAGGSPAGCVCCRDLASSAPCDYMECWCGPSSSFCTPCPQ